MKPLNEIRLNFPSRSVNEAFARSAIAAFSAQLDPTVEEISDIKTAVSEAVTNCTVHAYKNGIGPVYITASIFEGNILRIRIKDKGCGIEDVRQAMEPAYTTDPASERSGLGFTIMGSFTDRIKVSSVPGKGVSVTLWKKINRKN